MAIQLITIDEVVSNAFRNQLNDLSTLPLTFLEIAQENHIRPVLGDDFYDIIVAEHDADVFTGLNKTLVEDFIVPSLAFFVKYEILHDITMDLNSVGLLKNDTEFGESQGDDTRQEFSAKTLQHAYTLLRKMVRFIEKEQKDNDKFPDYDNTKNISNFVSKRAGIVIG